MPEILCFIVVFDPRVLEELVRLRGGKKDSSGKHAETMIKHNQDEKLHAQYEQEQCDPEITFKGSYRAGRYPGIMLAIP